jgi:hypothetical protein
MITGCEHNVERTIMHKPSAVNSDGKRVYVPGDKIYFVCPHGCPDITMAVKRTHEAGMIAELKQVKSNGNGRNS